MGHKYCQNFILPVFLSGQQKCFPYLDYFLMTKSLFGSGQRIGHQEIIWIQETLVLFWYNNWNYILHINSKHGIFLVCLKYISLGLFPVAKCAAIIYVFFAVVFSFRQQQISCYIPGDGLIFCLPWINNSGI